MLLSIVVEMMRTWRLVVETRLVEIVVEMEAGCENDTHNVDTVERVAAWREFTFEDGR